MNALSRADVPLDRDRVFWTNSSSEDRPLPLCLTKDLLNNYTMPGVAKIIQFFLGFWSFVGFLPLL